MEFEEMDELEEEVIKPTFSFENLDACLEDIPEAEDVPETGDIPENLREALEKSPWDRSWVEVEQCWSYHHPKYETQVAYRVDDVTGEALRDEEGHLLTCPRNAPGSQRLDGLYADEEGIHAAELKEFAQGTNPWKIIEACAGQDFKRRAQLGDDLDLCFYINSNCSLAEAELIQNVAQRQGLKIEFITK